MSDAALPSSGPRAAAPPRPQRTGDVLVFVAVSFVAGAVALASIVHLGLPVPVAAAVGLATHLVLFLGHLRLAQRPAGDQSTVPPRAGRMPKQRPAGRAAAPQPQPQAQPQRQPQPSPVARPDAQAATAPEPAEPMLRETPTPAAPARDKAEPDLGGVDFHRLGAALAEPRPEERLQPEEQPMAAAPPPATAAAFDEILRDLARTLERQPAAEPEASQPSPVPHGRPSHPASDSNASSAPAQEHLITQSVAALRAVGEAMQSYEQKAEQRGIAAAIAARQAAQRPAARTPAQVVLEEIADAIAAERVELASSPIVGLADHRLHHSELLMRLETASGAVIVPDGISSVARGTNLVPLLDALKAGRAVRVAQGREQAGEPGAVLCRLTGEGLMSKRVVRALAGEPSKPLPAATRVVPAFLQSEVRAFGHAHWTTLADLSEQGFRFAITDMQDLDLDWQLLRNVGFAFARIDAGLLLGGMPFQGTMLPAAEVGRLVGSAGLTLIADRIDSEQLLAPIHAFGVPYGQGQLFGGPSLIAADGSRVAA